MIFNPTFIKDLFTVELDLFRDDRGFFARTFCKEEFAEAGLEVEWLQINHSYTAKKATLRGMHFQNPPYKEIKLVRCISGAVYDVAIDLRKDSSTFLEWFGTELSTENKRMIYIPGGFAHGFLTLTDNCEIIYHHSNYYTPGAEGGIKFDDPTINIIWPTAVNGISDRDKNHPYVTENFKGI
ncbi:MAG: dTDP-4-dehydrorhamnose 3,5-epimerase [Ginsengibacter sp.]